VDLAGTVESGESTEDTRPKGAPDRTVNATVENIKSARNLFEADHAYIKEDTPDTVALKEDRSGNRGTHGVDGKAQAGAQSTGADKRTKTGENALYRPCTDYPKRGTADGMEQKEERAPPEYDKPEAGAKLQPDSCSLTPRADAWLRGPKNAQKQDKPNNALENTQDTLTLEEDTDSLRRSISENSSPQAHKSVTKGPSTHTGHTQWVPEDSRATGVHDGDLTPGTGNEDGVLKQNGHNNGDNNLAESDPHIPRTRDTSGDGSAIYALTSDLTNQSKTGQGDQCVVLSLCDGMGGAAFALKSAGIDRVTKYVAVEIDPTVRAIADYAHPKDAVFPGCDRSMGHDVFDIKEKDIAGYAKNSIMMVVGTGECKDFSPLRLLPDTAEYAAKQRARSSTGTYIPTERKRPGLTGKHGRTVTKIMEIIDWVKKYHPDARYLMENVVFDDHPDWATVNARLGEPTIINSHDYSTTNRRRALWTNCEALHNDPNKGQGNAGPINPNSCMDAGRTIIPYDSGGVKRIRPLNATYGGNPQEPVCTSHRKNMVRWEHSEEGVRIVHLKVSEAERLHGLPEGGTEAPTITPLDRLKAIGNGWDNHVMGRVIDFIVKDAEPISSVSYAPERVQQVVKSMERIKQLASVQQGQFLEVIKGLSEENLAIMSSLMEDTTEVNHTSSVIDSGAGRHVCREMEITDATVSRRLKGFEGTVVWTSGVGHKPIELVTKAGTSIDVDIQDVEYLKDAAAELLSMGKLINQGWRFNLSSQNLQATLPSGEIVALDLSDDHILMLPHDNREGDKATQLPDARRNGARVHYIEDDQLESVTSDYSKGIRNFMQDDPFCSMDDIPNETQLGCVIDDGNYVHDQDCLWHSDEGYHMYGD
jgi:site-specific DNA-cytosine methylase